MDNYNLERDEQLEIDPDKERMLTAIPMLERRDTWKQVMVWIGFGYVVTGLFIGGVLAGFGNQPGVPPTTALLAIALGMGTLFVLTVLLGVIAQKTGLNLALVSRYSYGSTGANLPLIIMGLLTLGWFASIVGMVGQIWGGFIGNPTGIIVFDPSMLGYVGIPLITLENFLLCFLLGIIFTITAYFGIEAIEKVAIPVAPIILIIAIVVGFGMLEEGGGLKPFFERASIKEGLDLGHAITLVIGSWIAGVVMGMDFFRFNKNVMGVVAGAFACFILTNPLLNIVGYIGAVQVGQFNYSEWMLNKGFFFALIGVLAWTASLWTTNNAELYCNSLYTGSVFSSYGVKVKRNRIVLIVGVLGTIVGSLAFYEIFFADFITILGAVFLPLAGPIIADYYLVNHRKYDLQLLGKQPPYRLPGILSFSIGAILGLIFQYFIVLPYGLPSGLTALVITIIIYPIFYKMFATKQIG